MDPDLIVANRAGDDVSVLINTGAGLFAPEVRFDVRNGPSAVAIGDVVPPRPDSTTSSTMVAVTRRGTSVR